MPRGEIDDPGGLPGGQPESGVDPATRPQASSKAPAVSLRCARNDAGIASSRFAQVMLYPLIQGATVCDQRKNCPERRH
jgi:hypothetical protein